MFFITAALLFELYRLDVDSCSAENERYVKQHFIEDRLIADNEVSKGREVSELGKDVICEVKNEEMNDGLSFLLYRVDADSADYIRLVNGLDGSSRLYGPFYQ